MLYIDKMANLRNGIGGETYFLINRNIKVLVDEDLVFQLHILRQNEGRRE